MFQYYTSGEDGARYSMQGHVGKHQVWSGAQRGEWKSWPRAFIVLSADTSLGLVRLNNQWALGIEVVSSCLVPSSG